MTRIIAPMFSISFIQTDVMPTESLALLVDPEIDITSVGMNEIKNMGAKILVI